MKVSKKMICRIAAILTIISFATISKVYAADKQNKITQDDMIYFIMTDRCNDGDESNNIDVNKNDPTAYHGGDFQGIIDKLDYIKGLGFTTIWITPVVKNQPGGYHGYWAVDFYKTSENLGSIEKLKELVQKAHLKGLKVIVDLVVNHTGILDSWVTDPNYKDWFHDKVIISNYNNPQEVENGWLSGLPDLKQENPEVKKYLIDMAKWWINEVGLDGYRLDTMKHVSKTFWDEFVQEIKKDYPDFYFIGEVYSGDVSYVSDYQDTGVDGLMDFPAYYALTDVFKNGSPEMRLEDVINKTANYKNRYLLGTFIDNHDVPRFVNNIDQFKNEKLEQALVFMMTYTGIPVMYYGTEIGLDGGADPDNRRDMEWDSKSLISDYVKKLTSIRKSNDALTRGDIEVLQTDIDVLSYSRKFGDNIIITVFNMLDSKNNVNIKIPGIENGANGLLIDLLDSKNIKVKSGAASFKMLPSGVNVFSYKEDGMNYLIIIIPAAVVLLSAIVVLFLLNARRKKLSQL